MTLPPSPVVPQLLSAPPEPEPAVTFPLDWLLSNASAPIQYRAITEVAKLDAELTPAVRNLPYTFRPALLIAASQAVDGSWGESIGGLPSRGATHFEGLGTVPAVRRLIECGWDRESPPVHHARRVLFRLLAEDDDPSQLYEFAGKKLDEEGARQVRQRLREQAGAALAQAGFEADPRLRGFARRTLDRVVDFLRSPLGDKPWVRVGNKQVLAAEAYPPTIHLLVMLAHMPLFRNEHYEHMEVLYEHLTRPLPRQESVQLVGKKMVDVPDVVLGDLLPHRNAVEDDVPAALGWLELVARLGMLKRHEPWTKMFERFVDDCGRDGVWHPHKGLAFPRSAQPWMWPAFPLEPVAEGDQRWTDVTFRVGLIARLAGREIVIR